MFFRKRRTISACLSVLLAACGGGGDTIFIGTSAVPNAGGGGDTTSTGTSAVPNAGGGGDTTSTGTSAVPNASQDPATKTPPVTPTGTNTGSDTGGSNNTNPPPDNSGSQSGGTTSTASYAYILQAATNAASVSAGTVYTGGSILKCSVDANGALVACSSSGMPTVNNPLSLTFSGSTAYIINQTAPDLEGGMGAGGQYPVLACAVKADGTLSGCAETFPGNSNETEFAFQLIANTNSSYALKETQVLICPSNFAGKCGQDPGGAAFPAGVVASHMVFADNRLYVLNAGSGPSLGSVLSWAVNSSTGALSTASTTVTDASFTAALRFSDGSGVDTPAGLAIKGQNAYIPTRYANKVIQCSYSGTANTMTACVGTTPLAALPGITPRHIAIQGSYAYITDSSSTAADNSVVKCTIGSADGKLGSCAVVSGMTFSTQIADIVFR